MTDFGGLHDFPEVKVQRLEYCVIKILFCLAFVKDARSEWWYKTAEIRLHGSDSSPLCMKELALNLRNTVNMNVNSSQVLKVEWQWHYCKAPLLFIVIRLLAFTH